MARIKTDSEELPNIIVAYLLDMLIHNDESHGNELFEKLLEDFQKKGMFPILLRYFRTMNPDDRRKYKLIKNGMTPFGKTNENTTIVVVPPFSDKEE